MLAHIMRRLARRPGMAIAGLATVALGTAASLTVTTVIRDVEHHVLPFSHPGELVWIGGRSTHDQSTSVSLLATRLWNARLQALSDIAAYRGAAMSLRTPAGMAPVDVTLASPTLFSALGRPAAIGRTLQAQDDEEDAPRVVVLSDAAWHRYYGGDSAVLGQTVELNQRPYAVVGVMPSDFAFPTPEAFGWIAIDAEMAPFRNSDARVVSAVARLRPGRTVQAAQRELARIGAPARADSHGADAITPYLVPLRDHLLRDLLPRARAMGAAAVLVFLLACTNAAALFAVGMLDRHREIAIRHALGAARWRLIAMVAQEGGLLAFGGAAAGYGLAWFQLGHGERVAFSGTPITARPPDIWLAIAAGAAATALYVGAATWHLYRPGPLDGLRSSASTSLSATGAWWRRILLSAELAATIVLVVGAGLAAQSVLRLTNADVGFDADGVSVVKLARPYTTMLPPQANDARLFAQRLLLALRDQPGVTAAAISSDMPSKGGTFIDRIGEGSRAQGTSIALHTVTPGYFSTLRIPVLAGRGFRDADDDRHAPVAIIDRDLARMLSGRSSVLGQRLRLIGTGLNLEVIGVTGDTRELGAGWTSPPAVYVPFAQVPVPRIVLLIRGSTGGESPAFRRLIASIDPQQAVPPALPLTAVVREPLKQPALYLAALTPFAILALIITAIGLYSVSSLALRQRRRELAIRAALGAEPHELRRLLLRQTLHLAVGGAALGMLGGIAFARVLGGLLEGVRPYDPLPWVASLLLVCVAVLLGTWGPAARAGRVDPARVLQMDS